MLWPQTITSSQAGFLGDALEPGRAHLARRADREAIAGDDERLAAMHAGAEVGHQVAERSGLPALVERLEALGDAVGRRRDLIGVDRVELLRLSGGLFGSQKISARPRIRRSAPVAAAGAAVRRVRDRAPGLRRAGSIACIQARC